MHTLARVCVQRPVFATVLSLSLVVIGLVSYKGLGVDLRPRIDFPRVSIVTALPGAAPEEIETDVTEKIEAQVNTIDGIELLSSTSSDGQSVVSIQFLLTKDINVASEEARAKVALARQNLPPDARDPVVSKFDLGDVPVCSFAISSAASVRDTYEYTNKVIQRRVESVAGVGLVQVVGGRERQINVVVDPYRLRAYGLTPADIRDCLAKQNVLVPGGLVEQGKHQLTLRTMGRVTQVKDFGSMLVKNLGGAHPVLLRDIARIEDGESRPQSLAFMGGRETVVMQVRKQSDANTIDVIRSVKERVNQVKADLPSGYRIELVRDQSTYIERALGAVREHLILGSFLAALVVFLFLANFRSTLIAALAIPTSVIATFALMKALDFTQNQVTLLALTLSVGIVIDDAIVVLENIFRVMEEEGLGPHDAAIKATGEIGLAVLAITVSLVAVFLPVAFMDGIIGRFLHSFGITMAGAIVISMLVSFSTTPMLCSRWLKLKQGQHHGGAGSGEGGSSKAGWFGVMENAYGNLLHICIKAWPLVAIVSAVTFFSIGPLMKAVNKNFYPDDDESQFQVLVRAPEGTSLYGTHDILEQVRAEVERLPEVRLTLITIGDDAQHTANSGLLYVRMNEVEERKNRKVTQFSNMAIARKKIAAKFQGRGQVISVQKVTSFGGSSAAVQLAVKGPDLDRLTKASVDTVRLCRKIPGVVDVDSSLLPGKPELQAHIDRQRASELGVNVEDVAQALRLAVAGDDKISSFDENGEGYEVHMRLDKESRANAADLSLLNVPATFDGAKSPVRLDQVARFVQAAAPGRIDHLNRQRQFTLRVNIVPGTSQQGVVDAVQKVLVDQQLGDQYTWEKLGQSREMARTFKNFGIAFGLSFVFMYLVIAAQFESFIHAVVIMITLPLTFPFALASILLTHDSLNAYSLLGVLVLLGVVKKNAILQIDRANQLRGIGLPLLEATVQASKDRLRPILMTTLAFVAGMFPLVLSSGTGSATNRTTASVIVGGQVFSLALTLIAAPVFYVVLDSIFSSRFCLWVRTTIFRQDRPES